VLAVSRFQVPGENGFFFLSLFSVLPSVFLLVRCPSLRLMARVIRVSPAFSPYVYCSITGHQGPLSSPLFSLNQGESLAPRFTHGTAFSKCPPTHFFLRVGSLTVVEPFPDGSFFFFSGPPKFFPFRADPSSRLFFEGGVRLRLANFDFFLYSRQVVETVFSFSPTLPSFVLFFQEAPFPDQRKSSFSLRLTGPPS